MHLYISMDTKTGQLEWIVVERVCSWHPRFFGQPLVLGTMLIAAQLGTFGSHGMCPACAQATRRQMGLKEAA